MGGPMKKVLKNAIGITGFGAAGYLPVVSLPGIPATFESRGCNRCGAQ